MFISACIGLVIMPKRKWEEAIAFLVAHRIVIVLQGPAPVSEPNPGQPRTVPPPSAPAAPPAAKAFGPQPVAATPPTTPVPALVAAPDVKVEANSGPVPEKLPATDADSECGPKPRAMMSIATSLASMNLVDMRALCHDSEKVWRQKNLETYARGPKDDSEKQTFHSELFAQMKAPLGATSWYRAETDFSLGDKAVSIKAILRLYGSSDTEGADPFKNNTIAKAAKPEELCYAISPFITYDGKMDNTTISSCSGPDRKKDSAFYISYSAYANELLASAFTMFLFPFPAKNHVPLEYLSTSSGKWIQRPDFVWHPSSFEEWQDLHDNYVSTFEGK